MSTFDLATTDRLLRAQWLHLREWLDQLDEDSSRAPSVLPGWTVAHLVAHVGRAMDGLVAAQPAADEDQPLSFPAYLGTYAGRTERIDEVTRELAARIEPDPLGSLDGIAEQAFTHLQDLRGLGPDPVVRTRVAAVRLSDFALSRLVELVVHGDDLDRSLPHLPGDVVLDEAVDVVARALLGVVVDRGGWSLEVTDPRAWVRVACGRTDHDPAALAAAVQPAYASDSLPDLGTVLPLL